MTDRRMLLIAAFLRALATGLVGVLLGIYLAARGFPAAESGLVVSCGLAGAAAAALAVTVGADRLGRRRTLVVVSLLAAAGGAALLVAGSAPVAMVAAFVGMVNGMGRDRGAALILDTAILPATVGAEGRTKAFAWYSVLQDAGHALGGLAAGAPTLLRAGGVDALASLQLALAGAVALSLLLALLYTRLSAAAEAPAGPRVRLSKESRRILRNISALFTVDSLAGGFLTASLLAYFFFERFGVSEVVVGALFFVARLANAGSHLAAAWLAQRIGLVRTMVFTHIPSSILLASVAWAPSFPVAALLFLLREGLVEMDVPTRQSYVMAVVRPEERTVASGVTHLVRVAAWSVAPAFAGVMVGAGALAWPLVIGAGMKIAYDLMLWAAFRRVRPPEEA